MDRFKEDFESEWGERGEGRERERGRERDSLKERLL